MPVSFVQGHHHTKTPPPLLLLLLLIQGAEKEMIVLATTTTNPRSEFCSDAARLNVALTRAKRHLVVVGAADVLSQAPGGVLRDLVWRCRGAGCCFPGSSILGLPGLAAGRQQPKQ